jgi:carbamoyltransferase
MGENMIILGTTFLASRNTAACIIKDGKLVAFSEEERHIRVKAAPYCFPINAINFCLQKAGVEKSEVDIVAIGQDEKMAHSDLISPNITINTPAMYGAIENMCEDWVGKIRWYPHHDCHAISSIIPSKFGKTNYLTADGVGDMNAGVYGYFDGEKLNHLGEIDSKRSLGAFYSHVTSFLGWIRNVEEGKTMGLACYGNVDDKILPEYSLNTNGFLECDSDGYRDYLFAEGGAMSGEIRGEMSWLKHHINTNIMSEASVNLAATTQHYFEKYMFSYIDHLSSISKSKNLCVAGGAFLNCTTNGKIYKRGDIENFFIQPASNDSGLALGAAIFGHKEITNEWPDVDFNTAYWGNEFTDLEIQSSLELHNLQYEVVNPSSHLADLIHNNMVVGYFEGKSEVGPRALCHRSILANPTIKENLDRVNKIKKREWWRPLAPTIAEDYLNEITDLEMSSPFMLMACQVRDRWKDKLPAITHVDGSCRPQSVNESQNKIIYDALLRFKELSGVPVFLNTSFNIQEPLVDSPCDAIRTFKNSELDALIMDKFCIYKV